MVLLLQAATFDYNINYEVAEATSKEVRAKNTAATVVGNYAFHTGLSCWSVNPSNTTCAYSTVCNLCMYCRSPVINIMRDPRWGRNQVSKHYISYSRSSFIYSFIGFLFY